MGGSEPVGRRTVLGCLASVVAGTATAGCSNDEAVDEADVTPVTVADPTPQPSPTDRVEVAGWPVADGELVDALRAAIHGESQIPGATLTVPDDGRRKTFEARLGDRLAVFDPPSTFLTVAGRELERYHRAVHLHPIPDLVPASDDADWSSAVETAVRVDDEAVAVPVATWTVDRWCVRRDLLDRANVQLDEIGDMTAFAAALDRIEDGTDTTGAVVGRDGASQLALLCDCLVAAGGRRALADAANGELDRTTLEAAVGVCVGMLGRGDRLVDPGTQAEHLAAGNAAFARGTPRCVAELRSDIRSGEVAITVLPGDGGPVRVDVLALPYPKRNPTPAATEAALAAVQAPHVAETIGRVPGILPADRAAWDQLDEVSTGHRDAIQDGDTVLAPSTGCAMDPSRRWQVLERLDALPTSPTSDDVLAALSPFLVPD